jgi:hypothetical protein
MDFLNKINYMENKDKEIYYWMLCMLEQGDLQQEFIVPLFQCLINSGDVWNLQGYHASTATELIEEGKCVFGVNQFRSAYGMCIPSRYDLKEGEPGTLAYQNHKGYSYSVL